MYKETFIVASACLISPLAHAGNTQVYQDRAQFNNNTGSLQIEDFESEALGSFNSPAAFDSGLGVNLFSGSVFSQIGVSNDFGLSNTTVNGRKYMGFGQLQDTGSYAVEFSFDQTINAFGFNITGFQPTLGANGLNISFLNNGQLVDDLFINSDIDFAAQFFGITSENQFNAIRVFIPVNTNGGGFPQADIVAFDDIAWSSVPSPTAASVLALGSLLCTRRRRGTITA